MVRQVGGTEGLRNTRRSMGDGTLSGRSRIATPFRADRRQRPAATIIPHATTVAGYHLQTSIPSQTWDGPLDFGTIERNDGFGPGAPAGDPTRIAVPRVGYDTLRLQLGLGDPPGDGQAAVIDVRVNGQPRQTFTGIVRDSGLDLLVHVGQTRFGDQVTVESTSGLQVTGGRMTFELVDASGTQAVPPPPEGWVKVSNASVWGLVGVTDGFWTTNGSNRTVSKYDLNWEFVTSFQGHDLQRERGITWDGTHLWVTGRDGWARRYTTTGGLDAEFAMSEITSGKTDLYTGLALDGDDLWTLRHPGAAGTGVSEIQVWSTAGVEQQTFSDVDLNEDRELGCHVWSGSLWVVDHQSGELVRRSMSDGTVVSRIDVSEATSSPTGVWIAADGTLYISRQGEGVWRRNAVLVV